MNETDSRGESEGGGPLPPETPTLGPLNGPPPLPGAPAPPSPEGPPDADAGPQASPAAPFTTAELLGMALRPYRLLDLILAEKDRLARTIQEGKGLWLLAELLLLGSLLFAIPYGAVCPNGAYQKIPLLFTGSLLICFPSLHVFSKYFGFKLDLAQNFIISLVISAVAAIMTFGFFPIIWFLDYTSQTQAGSAPATIYISRLLLIFSLFLGLVHLGRCFLWTTSVRLLDSLNRFLIVGWIALVIFITLRMAQVLEL